MEDVFKLDFALFAGCKVFAIRLAKLDQLSLQTTYDGLKDYPYLIVSEEGSGARLHQHILVAGYEVDDIELRQKIKEIYPLAKGNKHLYVQEAKKKKQLMKYTLKEGNFLYSGFTPELIKGLQDCSTSKTNMVDEFNDLSELLSLKQITFSQYVERYILLKSKYNQPIYTNHLEAYFRTKYIKIVPSFAKTMSKTIMSRLFDDYQDGLEWEYPDDPNAGFSLDLDE